MNNTRIWVISISILIVNNQCKQNNILLISPRRYGKTSVMKEVMRRLSERGYLCPFLDIMYVDAPEQFLIELATPQLSMKPVQGENFSKL